MSPRRSTEANRGRREDIEIELAEKYHTDYVYTSGVPTEQFDIDRSLHNQARFESLDEPTVAAYQEAVERGDRFPAVIAHRPGRAADPKLVIIDGNHRLVAHHRAGARIDVYEVDRATKAPLVALMTYAFNTRHGRPTSEEERTVQAVYLIDNGATHEQASAAVNVPLRLVKKAVAKASANKRADEVGVDRREWDALAQGSRSRLLSITTDEGFYGAAHLTYIARLNSEEVFDLVALLNTSRSAKKQSQLVKSETERYQDRVQSVAGGVLSGGTDRRTMTPKARLSMMLGQLLALPEDHASLARAYAAEERVDIAGRLVDAAERLRKLASVIDPTSK